MAKPSSPTLVHKGQYTVAHASTFGELLAELSVAHSRIREEPNSVSIAASLNGNDILWEGVITYDGIHAGAYDQLGNRTKHWAE